jgi:beta-alanine--pyruvate transaminase
MPPRTEAYWMPFTANRAFKKAPRLLHSAHGMHYETVDGRQVLDGIAGLWCVNAGHARARIVEAVQRQAAEMAYAPPFQMAHPLAFKLAEALASITPDGLDRVFFTNSGSEAVETALKIAVAWHRVRGEGQRTRLIGRERGYHGVNWGGMSVGGIGNNRRLFGLELSGVDHLRHTHDLARNAFTRGQPQHGAELANDLERLVALHDASTIAAVIVEPMAGSTGVLLPPAGYLQRLREICDRHGIVLIFDEVITGFGRLGSPFAAEHYNVTPDIMTLAKGLTNGAVPMGAVCVKREIHDAFMQGPAEAIELPHGYTCSGHPLGCAAGLATLETYAEEQLLTRGKQMEAILAGMVHSLHDSPHVIDIRNTGLVAAVELSPRDGAPGRRATEVFQRCYESGVLLRATGDTLAIAPPLIVSADQLGQITDTLRQALYRLA